MKDSDEIAVEDFVDMVKNSEYYLAYEDDVVEQLAAVHDETDQGVRNTVIYSLSADDGEEHTLVFIGDVMGVLLGVLEVENSGEDLMVYNLSEQRSIHVNGTDGMIYTCFSERCTAYYTELNTNNRTFVHMNLPVFGHNSA